MNESKKELIIESFEKMDLNMLEVLLDENNSYQEATKEVFLNKIEEIFTKLKTKGDTRLDSYKGFCNSDECCNKGCKGFSFVGNISKNHIDLIFEESDDDVNDVYSCSDFETFDKSLKKGNTINIIIMQDEEANFIPDVEYLIEVQKYNAAHEELYKHQNYIIDKNIYLPWIEKHNALYESLPFPPFIEYSKCLMFYWLYSRIDNLKKYLNSDLFAKKAIAEFENIDLNNETQLLNWLVRYEKTGEHLSLFMYDDFDIENPELRPYFIIEHFKISTSDFKYVAKFKSLFDERYRLMLEKYVTFTEEEKNESINQNSEMVKYFNSLSYHIEKRGFRIE